MKHVCLIGILFCCILLCCTGAPEPMDDGVSSKASIDTTYSLSSIDSVMQQWPDSALVLLLNCRDGVHTVSTDADRHYYQLLLAEALYKNDSVQANRKELKQAMTYYDSLCDCTEVARNVSTNIAFLSARTHYMNGVGYYENDSAVDACKEYMKAVEIMENHFNEKELVGYKAKLMALTYTHLTELYSDFYLHEQAIYMGKLSFSYYQKYNAAPEHIAWVLNRIGSHYEVMKELDSAEMYYKKAITYLNGTNLLIFRDISAHQAYLRYEITNQSNLSLIELNRLLSKAEYEREIMARSLAIGEIYYHEKQFDSALVYLQKVFIGDSRTDSKKQAAEWLVEICKAQGREAEMMVYASFLVPFANQEENNSTIKSQLTELYNGFRLRISDQQHQYVVRKKAQWTTVVLGALLIIIFAIIYFYYKNKRRLKHLENKKLEEPHQAQDKLLAFIEEPVCQDIIQSVQGQNIKRLATPKAFPKLVLTDAQLQQLNMLATKYFGPMDSLFEKHGLKAKPTLVNLCHLYILGMDEKQAAILLNRDYSSVKRYEKTLKTAFNTEENLVAFLRNAVSKQ